jgi:AraC-like DNA-binding protein
MTTTDTPREKSIIGSSSIDFADGHREPLHIHADYAQLKWPSSGVASVRTPEGIFVARLAHAVWIPAGERHGGVYSGPVLEQNLFVHQSCCENLPRRSCLIEVSPRLAETIARTVALHSGYAPRSRAEDEVILRTVEQEVADTGRRPLGLQLPESSPIQIVLEGLLRAPSDARQLAEWAEQLGMAERSLRRAFTKETGISFAEWRKRARVWLALRRLSTGCDVATLAAELGYESTSAFVYMFRTTLGTTPARYYQLQPRG